MDHQLHTPVYDHVAISNRARQLRAQAMADGARVFAAWVARRWAALAQRKGHQPA